MHETPTSIYMQTRDQRVNIQTYITMDTYEDKMLVKVKRMHYCTGASFK